MPIERPTVDVTCFTKQSSHSTLMTQLLITQFFFPQQPFTVHTNVTNDIGEGTALIRLRALTNVNNNSCVFFAKMPAMEKKKTIYHTFVHYILLKDTFVCIILFTPTIEI